MTRSFHMRLFVIIMMGVSLCALATAAAFASVDPTQEEQSPPANETNTSDDAEAPSATAEEESTTQEAEDTHGDLDDLLDQAEEEAPSALPVGANRFDERPQTYPRFEHHGYFRFRADLFYNGHLGTVRPGETLSGTSGLPAPLTENLANNSGNAFGDFTDPDDKTIGSANLRFRYQPTFHLAPTMRIKATVDVLDNMVLGSTPDFAPNLDRPDVPLVAFSGGQAPPSAGLNSFRDGIQVKEAYAEWQPAFLIRAGRMASDWGLGILANGGKDIDDDYGDYADRVMVALKLFDTYVVGAYDFVSSGAISDDPGELFGQPHDLGDADDVTQVILSIFRRPLSQSEKAKRGVALREELGSAFDWGLYGVYREQEMDLTQGDYTTWLTQGGQEVYDQLELVPRSAKAFIPDLWLRYQNRFDYNSGLRVELEATGIFGKVDNVTDDIGVETNERVIQQMGAALEIAYDRGGLTAGFDSGFASGDSAEGFGVKDRAVLDQPDGSPNREVTSFKFDRNYHVDLMLFREVIGTVTNAIYAKPYVAYDFFPSREDALGIRLDLMYAQAMEAEATPGNDPLLGMEADLRLFYEEKDRFNLDIEAGFLLPGPAFDLIDTVVGERLKQAEMGFTVQSRLSLQF